MGLFFFLIQDNIVALIFSCDLVYNHSKLTLIKKCSILSIEENIFLHWKKGCKTDVLVKCFQKNLLVPYEGTVALQYKKDYSNRQEKKKSNKKVRKESRLLILQKKVTFFM